MNALRKKLQGRLNEKLSEKEVEQNENMQRYANVRADMQL